MGKAGLLTGNVLHSGPLRGLCDRETPVQSQNYFGWRGSCPLASLIRFHSVWIQGYGQSQCTCPSVTSGLCGEWNHCSGAGLGWPQHLSSESSAVTPACPPSWLGPNPETGPQTTQPEVILPIRWGLSSVSVMEQVASRGHKFGAQTCPEYKSRAKPGLARCHHHPSSSCHSGWPGNRASCLRNQHRDEP